MNEFDSRTGFYKLWKVESYIRTLARLFPNTYHLAFFACCREIHDPTRHSGCVEGPRDVAVARFKEIDEQKTVKDIVEDQISEISKLKQKVVILESQIARVPEQENDQKPGATDEEVKDDTQHSDDEDLKINYRGEKTGGADHLPPSKR